SNADDSKLVASAMNWLEDCPVYGRAVDAAIDTDIDHFMTVVYDHVPTPVQQLLLDFRPQVKRAYSARTGQAVEDDDNFVFASFKPSAADVQAATAQNAANIKAANGETGFTRTLLACPPLVLIGEGHDAVAVDYVTSEPIKEAGSVTITKHKLKRAFGPKVGPTSFDVTGIATWKDLVQQRLQETAAGRN